MMDYAFIMIGVSLALLLVRAIIGKTIFDRLLAANVFGTNIVVLIVLCAIVYDSPQFIDMALVYALLNFVATICFLRYFRKQNND